MSKVSRNVFIIGLILLLILIGYSVYQVITNPNVTEITDTLMGNDDGGMLEEVNPLAIEALRTAAYSGSEIVIEETLAPGSNYDRYITSYQSDGNKIYALLTVPQGEKPSSGWPVVIFNHGFIPPAEYRTTERYIAYTDAFSRNGYIVFRSDYRGHGSSEGQATGGYGSNNYTIDVLNAVSSMKKYKDADPNRMGMWGHSMGGFITLRSMVVTKDIKAGVIWAGVVGSYPDLLTNWRRRASITPQATSGLNRGWRQALVERYGEPEDNPAFWASISANSFLKDISGPVQLHHGTADTSVPVMFSEKLEKQLKDAGKPVELYIYQGDDHNLANNLGVALDRSVAFFDKYVKNGK
jgi:uncharacterized protein